MRARTVLLVLLSLVAATLSAVLAPAVSAAPVWTPPRQLDARGSDVAVAANPAGDAVAVWVGVGDIGERRLFAAFRPRGGAWRAPAAIPDGGLVDAGDPQVVLDDAGRATVVWLAHPYGGPMDYHGDDAVLVTARGRLGGPWSEPHEIASYIGDQPPALALDSSGDVSVAWSVFYGCLLGPVDPCTVEQHAAGRYHVQVASRRLTGAWGPAVDLGEGNLPTLTAAPDGSLTAVWARRPTAGSSGGDIRTATRSAGGAWSATTVLASGGTSVSPPAAVSDLAAGTTAGWAVCDPPLGTPRCRYQTARRPASGGWGPVEDLVEVHTPPLYAPRLDLAVDGLGRVTAAWAHSEVLVATRRSLGGGWEPATALSNRDTVVTRVDLTPNRAGDVVAVWTASDRRGIGVQAAHRPAVGPWGGAVRVEAPRTSTSYLPSARVAAVGARFTVVFAGPRVSVSDRVDDRTRPTARLLSPSRPVVLGPRLRVAWTSYDGVAGIAGVDVRRRAAGFRGAFDHWGPWKRGATASSGTVAVHAGRTYCFSVRAVDRAGNVGRWSRARCTATPVDDRALRRTPGWRQVREVRDYQRSHAVTTRAGARLTLTGVRGRRVALVATTCPRCGSVSVRLGRAWLGRVSLRSASVRHTRVLPVASFAGVRTGSLTVRVTTSGRPVPVDGVVIAR